MTDKSGDQTQVGESHPEVRLQKEERPKEQELRRREADQPGNRTESVKDSLNRQIDDLRVHMENVVVGTKGGQEIFNKACVNLQWVQRFVNDALKPPSVLEVSEGVLKCAGVPVRGLISNCSGDVSLLKLTQTLVDSEGCDVLRRHLREPTKHSGCESLDFDANRTRMLGIIDGYQLAWQDIIKGPLTRT